MKGPPESVIHLAVHPSLIKIVLGTPFQSLPKVKSGTFFRGQRREDAGTIGKHKVLPTSKKMNWRLAMQPYYRIR